jgi:hypothetical protein
VNNVAWLQRLGSRYPNLTMIDARHAGYDKSVFVDEVHLDGEGAQVLSTNLGRLIRERLSAPSAGLPRWVSAARFTGPPAEYVLQDINGSRIAVKQPHAGRKL